MGIVSLYHGAFFCYLFLALVVKKGGMALC